ncbi:unnamed protein product [Lampetra fluviatilis]
MAARGPHSPPKLLLLSHSIEGILAGGVPSAGGRDPVAIPTSERGDPGVARWRAEEETRRGVPEGSDAKGERLGTGRRRARTAFTPLQVTALEAEFAMSRYPDPTAREILAARLDISDSRIQVWFQNRRARWRRSACSATVCDTHTHHVHHTHTPREPDPHEADDKRPLWPASRSCLALSRPLFTGLCRRCCCCCPDWRGPASCGGGLAPALPGLLGGGGGAVGAQGLLLVLDSWTSAPDERRVEGGWTRLRGGGGADNAARSAVPAGFTRRSRMCRGEGRAGAREVTGTGPRERESHRPACGAAAAAAAARQAPARAGCEGRSSFRRHQTTRVER